MSIFSRIAGFFSRMIPKVNIESALRIEIATSQLMLDAQDLWRSMFFGDAPWNDKIHSRRTASQIASEYGRVTTVEHESTVAGSPRADWLNVQYQTFVKHKNLRTVVSKLAAGGEIILKPWPNSKNGFTISVYENNQFYPIKYDSEDELTRFVVFKYAQHKKWYYTLAEENEYTVEYDEELQRLVSRYTIINTAFESNSENILGVEVPLTDVEEWAHLEPEYHFADVSPWFVHVKMPTQNDIEQSDRNGVSIYAKAVNTIRQIDEHGELTEHEFNAGRLKQNVTTDMLERDPITSKWVYDKDIYAIFRNSGTGENTELPETYNPDPRIESYSQREQRLFREAEFLCQMSYGILSDAQQQEKTATEVHASLARFDNSIKSIQDTMEDAQRQLVKIVDEMTTVYYPQVPQGEYNISFFWDDSVIASAKEKAEAYGAELTRLMAAEKADLIKPEVVTAFMLENSEYIYKLTDKLTNEEFMLKLREYMPIEETQTKLIKNSDNQFPLEGDADG